MRWSRTIVIAPQGVREANNGAPSPPAPAKASTAPGAGFRNRPLLPVLPCLGKAAWTRPPHGCERPSHRGDDAAAHSDHGLSAGPADGGVAVARRRASTMSRSATLESPRGQARRLNRPQLSDR